VRRPGRPRIATGVAKVDECVGIAKTFPRKRQRAVLPRHRRGVRLLAVTPLVMAMAVLPSQSPFLSAQETAPESLPTVVVLSTGGTIASTRSDEEAGYTSNLQGEQLVAAVPGLDQVALIEVQNVVNVGSTNMTPALWLEVSRRATAALERDEVAGVLVTHGTDTMEETAYFLDLTVTSDKPVIIVGAMRAASEWDADGPRNLLNAARVAVSEEARGKGTFVVLNGEIHAAREVTKTHSLAVETFGTPEFGALGIVDADGVRFYRAPLRRQSIPMAPDVVLPTVDIISNYAGSDGRLIRGLLKEGPVDGLVVDASGAGNIATALFEAVREARDQGIAVVITSRTHSGRVLPLYAGGGGGTTLQELGCVFADNLSAQKARVLLIAALTRTTDPEELRRYFDR
jgi:L-asparaginase